MVKGREASDIQVWGLTGGIAAGKSAVAQILSELGASILDADQIARELSAPGGKAAPAILKRFGTLDRAELRAKIFQDSKAKRDLEGILHPLIQEESRDRIDGLKRALSKKPGSHLIIYEAALLLEAERLHEFDGIILVIAPTSARMDRLMKRNGHSKDLAEKIIASQALPQKQKDAVKTLSHFVIENDGAPADLQEKIERWYRGLFTS